MEEWHVKPGVAPEALCMLMGNFGIYSTITVVNGAYVGLPTYLGLNFCSCFFPFFHGGQAYAAYAAQAAAAAAAAAAQAQQAQAAVQPREDENGTRSMVDHLGFLILYPNSSQTPTFVTCLEPQVHTNPSISPLNSTN